MGNAPSKDGPEESAHPSSQPPTAAPALATPAHTSQEQHGTSRDHSVRRPGRRESIPTRPAADPPSVSPESVQGHHATPPSHVPISAQLRQAGAQGRQRSHTSVDRPASSELTEPGRHASSVPSSSLANSKNPSSATIRARSPSQPVTVPAGGAHNAPEEVSTIHYGSGPSPASYYTAGQDYTRPPRLPLPIEEEIHSPGSPIISPADVKEVFETERASNEGRPVERQPSMLSTTTVDEEEWTEELQSTTSPNSIPTFNTLIEWEEEGSKVYVTGSFANWDRKFRLSKNGPSKKEGVFSTVIPLPAGTHHLLFLVDSVMKASSKMPVTVDFTTSLVNYVEVGPYIHPQASTSTASTQRSAPSAAEARPQQSLATDSKPASPAPVQPAAKEEKPEKRVAKKHVTTRFHSEIPKFLLDLDAPEDSTRFHRASAVLSTQPAPPSLPMFLSKSILNGATPMKDDASVLVLPNHTVLNHLATSSIKNNVLATSATTRYKRKFLTTIMYKPTSEADD